jgi:outer membrane protein assembly factor BamB
VSALRLASLGVAALVLSGCGVFGIGRSSDLPKPTPLTEIKATVTPKALWSVSVGKSGGFLFQPELEGGRVFAAAADGMVTLIDEESGRVVSRLDTKKKLSGGLAVEESRIIVGTMKGDVLAFDPAGKQAWASNVAGEVIAPASVSRKVAVVRTADGRIFGLGLEDGKRKWVYQRPMPSLLLRTEVGVLTVGGDVVAGYPGGKLIALDIEDGKLTWEVTVSLPRGSTELERIADIAGVPAMDGSRVCAAAFQGKVACFEIQTRNMVWSRDLWSSRGLVVDAKNLYIADDTGNVHALDKGSGASVWKQDKLANRRLTAPLIVGGHLVVGDGLGYLHVLSTEDGSLIGRLSTDGSAVQALVKTPTGLVVQTAGGSVVSVRL